jgi:sensor c-di-GMP phosphodiesterase-like protein
LAQLRKHVTELALLLAGAALGGIIAWGLARQFQLRAGIDGLRTYTLRLLHTGEALAGETDNAFSAVADSNLPFCSDQELNFMRAFVFNSMHVKEIGRTRNDVLYCTTGSGRLAVPLQTPQPDLTIGDVKFIIRSPLIIAPGTKGVIVEGSDATVVLNPAAYEFLNQPPEFFSGMFLDRDARRVYPAFGRPVPLSSPEVLSQGLILRDGIFYQPLCSQHFVICVVGAEPQAAIMTEDEGHFITFVGGGVLLGGSFALTAILYYHRQRSLERRLRRAIQYDVLTVAYQPIVDLDTGRIVAAEALARWKEHDESVPPDVFIPIAEERGFVVEITRRIVSRVANEMSDLLRQDGFRISVNITAQDLADEQFQGRLERCLGDSRILNSSLGLELTERESADHIVATQAIARLKALGHKVYIDDFGSGYSNLAYLHQLSVDAIKIDRAFTRTVGTDAVTASVVPQILDIASQLQLQVVVEGIETVAQADYFRRSASGILGQGWLFGRPVPAAQFRKLLVEQSEASNMTQAV